MKKIIAILLVLVLALGMFAGCGAPEDDKIVIAGIYKAGDQEWFIGEGEAAKKQALSMIVFVIYNINIIKKEK